MFSVDLERAREHSVLDSWKTLDSVIYQLETCSEPSSSVKGLNTLLENAVDAALKEERPGEGWTDGKGRFLIDGFPRKMDQALKFDEEVCLSSSVIFFQTTEEVMLQRLLKRGETSGREDDNVESIRKRFYTYKKQTMPVIEYYAEQGKVAEIDSTATVEVVHKATSALVRELFAAQGTSA